MGGIVVWLCETTLAEAPAAVAAATPTCPQSGTVSGTIAPAQVLAQPLQGFPAGDLKEVVRANEIRGHINDHGEHK